MEVVYVGGGIDVPIRDWSKEVSVESTLMSVGSWLEEWSVGGGLDVSIGEEVSVEGVLLLYVGSWLEEWSVEVDWFKDESVWSIQKFEESWLEV